MLKICNFAQNPGRMSVIQSKWMTSIWMLKPKAYPYFLKIYCRERRVVTQGAIMALIYSSGKKINTGMED